MKQFHELFQSADWKQEKHVPVITAPDKVKKGEFFDVEVGIGKEIAHPNKTEHHIRWIVVYFQPEGEKFPYEIGRAASSVMSVEPRRPANRRRALSRAPCTRTTGLSSASRRTSPGPFWPPACAIFPVSGRTPRTSPSNSTREGSSIGRGGAHRPHDRGADRGRPGFTGHPPIRRLAS